MEKIDFKKRLDSYQAKHNEFRIISVPVMKYLMIDGHGDPNTSLEFRNAIETLYPFAYKLKFLSKNTLKKDYVVGPLEGLWWAENMENFTTKRDKSNWDWTMMIMQPDWITKEMFIEIKEKLKDKAPIYYDRIKLEELAEGLSVQTLHIGSFDAEGPVLDIMHHEFIPENNLEMTGKHHEIYLSDFRKVSANKLKTILRQPVATKIS